MTIITDHNHKVVSVSLIPGLADIPAGFHVYFPAECKDGIPAEGQQYIECEWMWPLPGISTSVPTGAGGFGAVRKFDVHCGLDLYCDPDQVVVAMEDGKVMCTEIFTGPNASPPSPWWNETCAIYVEGTSGVIVYGEIQISSQIRILQEVKRGQVLGTVKTVLRNDKGLPMTMLHMELHRPGTRSSSTWELDQPMPHTLIDPTPYLLHIHAKNTD